MIYVSTRIYEATKIENEADLKYKAKKRGY